MIATPTDRDRVVVVLRAPTAERFVPVAETLAEAGVTRLEFTLTSAGALDAIAAAKAALPGILVGCGTVRSAGHLTSARDAGADFAVSQYLDPELVDAARSLGLAYVPGALTPAEIVAAARSGADLVKVSPIGPVGGLAYLRELVGPLPDVPLFPTGGVKPEELGGYVAAGATLVGLSALLLEDALHGGDLRALTARTRRALATLDQPKRATSVLVGAHQRKDDA